MNEKKILSFNFQEGVSYLHVIAYVLVVIASFLALTLAQNANHTAQRANEHTAQQAVVDARALCKALNISNAGTVSFIENVTTNSQNNSKAVVASRFSTELQKTTALNNLKNIQRVLATAHKTYPQVDCQKATAP